MGYTPQHASGMRINQNHSVFQLIFEWNQHDKPSHLNYIPILIALFTFPKRLLP